MYTKLSIFKKIQLNFLTQCLNKRKKIVILFKVYNQIVIH